MNKLTYDDQLVIIASKFFKAINVKVTKSYLRELLYSHPDYPSLLSLSDTCTELGVESIAIQTTVKKIQKVELPIIAHLYEKGGTFIIVKKIENDKINYLHPDNGIVAESLDHFDKKWSGIVFLSFPNKQSGENNYFNKRIIELFNKSRTLILLSSIIILLGGIWKITNPSFSSEFIFLLFTKLCGLFVSINLVIHSLGKSSSLLQNVCNFKKSNNCDDVLNSSASKFFRFISMSDLCLIYFGGGLVLVVVMMLMFQSLFILYPLLFLSLLSFPFVLFSLYYQFLRLRKACPLCLSIVFILLLEITFSVNYIYTNNIDITSYVINSSALVLIYFIIISCSWLILRELIDGLSERDYYKLNLLRLKRNPRVYNAFFVENKSVDMNYSDSDVWLGSKNAKLTITCVINSNCTPCAKAHIKLKQILSSSKSQINLNLRFVVTNGNDREALHLIELYSRNTEIFEKAIDDWFLLKDYNLLIEKYPVENISNLTRLILERHNQWCFKQNILYTPTFFFNDKMLEKEYSVEDVQWLVKNTYDG